ncbi:MAG: winged helix-turn-helix domain-containing protein [Lacipirellulaceae bacterium]
MAKKTAKKSPSPVPSATPVAVSPVAKKVVPKKAEPKKAVAKSGGASNARSTDTKPSVSSAESAPLDATSIGNAAGEAWKLLAEEGPQTLAALKKLTPGSADLTLMALGWLAREGKLGFVTSGKTQKVALRD